MTIRSLLECCALSIPLAACQIGDSVGMVPFGSDDGAVNDDEAGTLDSEAGPDDSDDQGPADDDGDDDDEQGSSETGTEAGTIFDVGSGDGDGDGDGDCASAQHVACDADTSDPFRAMGLGCPGENAVTDLIDAHPAGLGVLEGFGPTTTYAPREGDAFTVLSTGHVAELGDEPGGPGDQIFHCNKWFDPNDGMDTSSFPDPIVAQDVGGDCIAQPGLVGTGDCSNTIASQFAQSGAKYDYQELRASMVVPEGAYGLSFDVAYLTTEWPVFAGQPYNDMFIAWLESPSWTGNISYDQGGNPLSLNAAFFDFQDTDGDLQEFAGTCLRYGAGTPWLTSTAAVTPGEEIELVFAIFDLDDVNLDSLVFLDNFRWQCEGGGGPSTEPVG